MIPIAWLLLVSAVVFAIGVVGVLVRRNALVIFMWVRWTFPRLRYDQLMQLGWKVLLPLALLNIAVTGVGLWWGTR